jgi:peptide/nickel transport system permease protein
VQAARFAGVPAWKVILKHIVPNMASLLIIDATVNVGQAVLAETGLSYLGFGVQPPDVSLGTLISEGTASALTFPWLFLFAGGLLVVTVLAVNLVGDGLRDALDPRGERGGRA